MSSRFLKTKQVDQDYVPASWNIIARYPFVPPTKRADPASGGRVNVTSLNKSDIVSKAASMHLQESITMPEEIAPEDMKRAATDSLMPIDDPIGAALRRLHDEVVAEPIPDEFLRLLGEIERKLDGAATSE